MYNAGERLFPVIYLETTSYILQLKPEYSYSYSLQKCIKFNKVLLTDVTLQVRCSFQMNWDIKIKQPA